MRQNNPLLYVFVGMPEGDLESIREIQSNRVDVRGVGYLSVDGRYSKEQLLDGIRDCQSRFLTKIYVTSGEIKVVYAINADADPAVEFSVIKRDVDRYLQYLYPGGILTDIFLLLDDAVNLAPANRRWEVIERLDRLHSDTCMIYMMSNVDSRKLYEPEAHMRILSCIALMGIMKDYVSLQPSDQISRWYNERYFKEDCYRGGGIFLTAGYLNIRRPVEVIKKLMLIELLQYGELKGSPECEFIWSGRSVSSAGWLMENLNGLCLNAGLDWDSLENRSNAEALDLLFEGRLDRFFELNYKAEHVPDGSEQIAVFLQSCARNPAKGFYYIYALTAPDGELRLYLKRLLADVNAELSRLDANAAEWRGGRCAYRRRGLPRVPEEIYEMAAAYLEPRFQRIQPELEAKRLNAALDYVSDYHKRLSQNYGALRSVIESCRAEAERLQADDALFGKGAIGDYYLEQLRALIREDKRFEAIYARLWRSFDKLSHYVAELERYIDDMVMPTEGFSQGVVEDLAGSYNGMVERGVYDGLWEYIIKNRYFHILLKSGGKSLHSEINVFIDVSGKMGRNTVAREKINFFYENNADAIDVIYHGGAFSGADLYYEALYRQE